MIIIGVRNPAATIFLVDNFQDEPLLLLNTLEAIGVYQETDSFPVKDLSLRHLFRMNIEFIEDYHNLVLQIVQRPLVTLAVRE